MSVLAIKLASSEELIGEFVSQDEKTITLKNVVSVAVQQTEKGPALGFLPFMPYLPKKVEICFDKTHVILQNAVDEQMENQYNSVFGGILKPSKSIITG